MCPGPTHTVCLSSVCPEPAVQGELDNHLPHPQLSLSWLSQFVLFSPALKVLSSTHVLLLLALYFSNGFAHLFSVLNCGIFGSLWVTFGCPRVHGCFWWSIELMGSLKASCLFFQINVLYQFSFLPRPFQLCHSWSLILEEVKASR